ncbi:hypothetical protein SAMN05421754_102414 [Nitrosomonas sp. Nm58]|nr:hypothetical protein SAMN05421754_102414 [Nitrosomonas sp. Nm58]
MYAALPLVPFVAALLATVFTTLNGRFIKKQTGKGIARQAYEQIGLANRFAILPPGTTFLNCTMTVRKHMLVNT